MINTDKLRGLLAERGLSGSDAAALIGVSPQTFYRKMKRGVFGSDEIETLIEMLEIEAPMDIFFTRK